MLDRWDDVKLWKTLNNFHVLEGIYLAWSPVSLNEVVTRSIAGPGDQARDLSFFWQPRCSASFLSLYCKSDQSYISDVDMILLQIKIIMFPVNINKWVIDWLDSVLRGISNISAILNKSHVNIVMLHVDITLIYHKYTTKSTIATYVSF